MPCPAKLVLLPSAISLGRLGFGMVFSMGLAVVLTAIGLLMVYARRLFERYTFEARPKSEGCWEETMLEPSAAEEA